MSRPSQDEHIALTVLRISDIMRSLVESLIARTEHILTDIKFGLH